MGCIVSGDIGCYTLGVLPPFSAMDCSVAWAQVSGWIGTSPTLAEDEARKSCQCHWRHYFVHSGITGIVEMVYNRPATGHLVLIWTIRPLR